MSVIRTVSLAGFRGAPVPLTVDFENRNGKPSSALLIGDNGTGKSTIVDAIEFCLQAKVGRLAAFNDPSLPGIANYRGGDAPVSSVTFADGTTSTRHATLDEDGHIAVADRTIHPDFTLAPITIKRSDLLRFAGAARNDRLLQLLDFMNASVGPTVSERESKLSLLEEARRREKDRRRELTTKLAGQMALAPDAVPVGQQFEGFIARYGRDRSAKNQPWRVKPNLWPLVRDIRQASAKIKQVEGDIAAARRRSQQRARTSARLGTIRDVLASASATLTDSFLKIANDTFVSEVILTVSGESDVSLDVRVRLPSNKTCPPTRVLSEGKQDLLTLLLFIALTEEAARLGQPKLLVLDDTLQNLSGEVRLRFAEYVIQQLHDWQLIITIHDRLWAAQLRSIMDRLWIPDHRKRNPLLVLQPRSGGNWTTREFTRKRMPSR